MFKELKPVYGNKEFRFFALNQIENNKLIKLAQIVFGIVCISIAIYWLGFNIKSPNTTGTIWITIIFLLGFGIYQLWSGIGYSARFIEIGKAKVRLKKTIFLPAIEMLAEDIQKIEVYPFNLSFSFKSGKKIILRLSSTYYETNAKIKDEILNFAEENSVNSALVEEKI